MNDSTENTMPALWPWLAEIGAGLNALCGLALCLYALIQNRMHDMAADVAWLYAGIGLSAILVTAPILGCLAVIAKRSTNH